MSDLNFRRFGQISREIWPVEFCLFTRVSGPGRLRERLRTGWLCDSQCKVWVICLLCMHALRVAECPCIETMLYKAWRGMTCQPPVLWPFCTFCYKTALNTIVNNRQLCEELILACIRARKACACQKSRTTVRQQSGIELHLAAILQGRLSRKFSLYS